MQILKTAPKSHSLWVNEFTKELKMQSNVFSSLYLTPLLSRGKSKQRQESSKDSLVSRARPAFVLVTLRSADVWFEIICVFHTQMLLFLTATDVRFTIVEP